MIIKTAPAPTARVRRRWTLGYHLAAIALLAIGSGGCAFLAGTAAGAGGMYLFDHFGNCCQPHCCWSIDPERADQPPAAPVPPPAPMPR